MLEAQCDHRAPEDVALQDDIPPMQFDDGLDDGQAESASSGVRCPCRVDAIKAVEHALQMLRRYPTASVADEDLGIDFAFADPDDDRPAAGRILHRVGDEIDERPAQQRAFGGDFSSTLAADIDALLFRDLIEEG